MNETAAMSDHFGAAAGPGNRRCAVSIEISTQPSTKAVARRLEASEIELDRLHRQPPAMVTLRRRRKRAEPIPPDILRDPP
jgi:hypothetical protein